MANRSRNISGEILNTRTAKAYIAKLKSNKYLMLAVIVFSAWLSLHFVRATTEYHIQAASKRGKEQVKKNLDGIIKVYHDDVIQTAESPSGSTSSSAAETKQDGRSQSNQWGEHGAVSQNGIEDAPSATASTSTRGFTSGFKSKIEALAGVRRTLQPGSSTTELPTYTRTQYHQAQGAVNKYPAIGTVTSDDTTNPVSTSTEWFVTRSYKNPDNRYDSQINDVLQQQYNNLPLSQYGWPKNPKGGVFDTDRSTSTPAVTIKPFNTAENFRDSNIQPVNTLVEPIQHVMESSVNSKNDIATSGTSTPVYHGRLGAILMPSAYNNNYDDNKGDGEERLIYSNNNIAANKRPGQTIDKINNVNEVNMDKTLDQNNINYINNNNFAYNHDNVGGNVLNNNNYNNGNLNRINNNYNSVNNNNINVNNDNYNTNNNDNNGYNSNNKVNSNFNNVNNNLNNDNNRYINNNNVNNGYNSNNNVNSNFNNVNNNLNNDNNRYINNNNDNNGYINNNNVNNGYINNNNNNNNFNSVNNGYVDNSNDNNNFNNVNNGYIINNIDNNKVNNGYINNNNDNNGYINNNNVNIGYVDNSNDNNNLNTISNGYINNINNNNVNNGYVDNSNDNNNFQNTNNGYINSNMNIFKSDVNLDTVAKETDGSTTMASEESVTTHMIGNTAPNINENDKILKIENEQQFIVEKF